MSSSRPMISCDPLPSGGAACMWYAGPSTTAPTRAFKSSADSAEKPDLWTGLSGFMVVPPRGERKNLFPHLISSADPKVRQTTDQESHGRCVLGCRRDETCPSFVGF